MCHSLDVDNPNQTRQAQEVQSQVPNSTWQSQMPSPVNDSGKSRVIPIILGAAAFVVIAIGAYVLGTKQSQPIVQNSVQTTPIPTPTPVDETTNWKTYNNDEFGFEFQYPEDWLIEGDITTSSRSINMFNAMDPYSGEGDFLKSDVMKAQFQYRVGGVVSSQQAYIDNIIKKSDGPPNPDFPEGIIDREWIRSFVNGNGVEIIEFRKGRTGDLHYVMSLNNNFSEVLEVLVWNPDVRFDQILSTFKFTP